MTHAIVVGLGFGDECKGATVDWLCATNDIKAVVRLKGGPHAAHNGKTPQRRSQRHHARRPAPHVRAVRLGYLPRRPDLSVEVHAR